jgi:hypothetical protein
MQPLKLANVFSVLAIGTLLCAGGAWLALNSGSFKRPGQMWVTGFLVSEHLYLLDSGEYISAHVGEQGEFARYAGKWSLIHGSIQLTPDMPGQGVRWLRRQEQFGCKGLRAVDSTGKALSASLSEGFYFRPGSC